MKVIGLVGKAGAGKDVVCEIIEKKYPSIRMGGVVIEETRRRGLPLTHSNVGAVANDLRKKEGMDAIARRCLRRIEAMQAPIVLVNGIRGVDEVKLFRDHFPNFVVVEVWAPDRTRYDRIRSRARPDDVKDYDEFLERDRREDSWGQEEAISMASHRIANDDTIASLEARTEEVLKKIESDC